MYQKILILLLISLVLVGCATPYPVGVAFTELEMPGAVVTEGDVSYTKVGISQAKTYFGLIATGDASVRAAIRDGQISQVKFIDYSVRNVLGIVGEYETRVYGD